MKHYIEITLIPDGDLGLFLLWSKVYLQLHLALVELKEANSLVPVGVSFAEYRSDEKHVMLGSKLRVFASNINDLEKLNLSHWLNRLNDYVHISRIRAVPNAHQHVLVSRVHAPSNVGNLARRYAKRHGISMAESLEKYQNYEAKQPPNLAFIKIKSLSLAHDFTLCILQSVKSTAQSGFYNTYGLSHTSTVPYW